MRYRRFDHDSSSQSLSDPTGSLVWANTQTRSNRTVSSDCHQTFLCELDGYVERNGSRCRGTPGLSSKEWALTRLDEDKRKTRKGESRTANWPSVACPYALLASRLTLADSPIRIYEKTGFPRDQKIPTRDSQDGSGEPSEMQYGPSPIREDAERGYFAR